MKKSYKVPELSHDEGSWVCTNDIHCVELFGRRSVELLAARGWKIETIGTYLARINKEVAQPQTR